MKKIVITGVSGTVGQELVKHFLPFADELDITLFDIKSKKSTRFLTKYAKQFNVVYGDITNKEDVNLAFLNVDIVMHLAAIIPPLADENPELAYNVNVVGTQNIIQCLEANSPNAFLLYSSSISVYGDRLYTPNICVSDPLMPSDRDEYAKTKIEAEKLIQNSKLAWSIFRLTAIMGINNHKTSGLMFHMPLETKMEIATPIDTARAFFNSFCSIDVLNGNIYNLGGGEQCRTTYAEFMHRSFEVSGLGTPDFVENTFAKKNFHCGYYTDGDELNSIVNFRTYSLNDYFNELENSISPVQRFITKLFRKSILKKLQSLSEPLAAVKTGNKADIEHYF